MGVVKLQGFDDALSLGERSRSQPGVATIGRAIYKQLSPKEAPTQADRVVAQLWFFRVGLAEKVDGEANPVEIRYRTSG